MPADLSPIINGSNVDITGAPTAADVGNYTVTVEDANGAQATNNVVVNAAPTLGALTPATATAAGAYSGTIAITGGTGPFNSLSTPGLPTDLSANIIGASVVITGTPASTDNGATFGVSLDDANGAVATNSYTLTVTPSATNSTVAVLSSTIQSGTSTTVTVTAEDAVGSPISGLTASDIVLTVGNGAAQGTFDPTSFASLGGGMYSETFTGTTAGTGNIIATIDGATILSSPSITVTPGVASGSTSTVSVLPGSIQAGNNTTVTVVAEDAAGNLLTGLTSSDFLFHLVGTGTSHGNFDPTSFANLGGGQYSETFTGTTAGTANTITVTIDGALVSTAPPITVTPGPIDLTQSTVSVVPNTISLSGVNQATVTLTTKDSFGNQETNGGGATVVFSVDPSSSASGTFSTPQDNGDGTYSATFSGTVTGMATIDATINGAPLLSTPPTLTVNP